jgi:amidase
MTNTLTTLPSDCTSFTIDDTIGAFVPHGRFTLAGAASGPLHGLTFAVKDLFDIAGIPTAAGNPTWLATHPIPTMSNPVVTQLLAAGATLVGKTLTDEIAYSIHGDNFHYGTPINVAAPGRVPGGSSSGSVAAVTAKLCDFALGTDTGGSTRVPASYCGVWGLRTTHGLLPNEGMVPLNPSFDTSTWFASDANVFQQVGEVLLPQTGHTRFTHAVLPTDVLAQADAVFHEAAQQVLTLLGKTLATSECTLTSSENELDDWRLTYIGASAYEAWQVHGDWITTCKPVFGPAVQSRWEMAKNTTADKAAAARAKQADIKTQVQALLGEHTVAVIPSAASVAPLLDTPSEQIDLVRSRTFRITCIAGLCGLPQVSIPLTSRDGLPIGISLLGPVGSDLSLIRLATTIAAQLHNH